MVDPKIMCRKHLLGEHVECHMFVGTIKKKVSLFGYLNNNLFEPKELFNRHNLLKEEMIRRGINHKSPLEVVDTSHLPSIKVDSERSLEDLISRCPECRKNYLERKI